MASSISSSAVASAVARKPTIADCGKDHGCHHG
jgi:hypothetical protein